MEPVEKWAYGMSPEKKKEYNKQYYIKNKKRHLDKLTEKLPCECGKYVQRVNMHRHKESLKHKIKVGEVGPVIDTNTENSGDEL